MVVAVHGFGRTLSISGVAVSAFRRCPPALSASGGIVTLVWTAFHTMGGIV